MSQNTEVALKQAFSLIEAGDLEDAKAILRPILESDKDNADIWWLYSHAVTDPETARLALNNVLRIEPDYPDARDLLNQLEAQQKNEQFDDFPDADKEPAFIPAMPSSIPGIKPLPPRDLPGATVSDTITDDFPDDVVGEEEEAFYRRPLFYVPLITILLLVALAIVIIKPFAVNSPSPQTTEIATQIPVETVQSSALNITATTEGSSVGVATSTLQEVSTEAVTPTSEGLNSGAATSTPADVSAGTATSTSGELTIGNTTSAPTGIDSTATDVAAIAGSDGFATITTDFSGITLTAENPISIDSTNLGQTLRVSVCTSAGKEMRELLPRAMETLAKSSVNYASQVQAISVQMVDCTSNSTLLWIGSSIDDATAFANATLSDKDYQAKWRPVASS